jgi:hypothetical protein
VNDFLSAFKDDEVIEDLLRTAEKLEQTFYYLSTYSTDEEINLDFLEDMKKVALRDCYELLKERFEEIVKENDI